MKKVSCLALAILLAIMLCGCGGSGNGTIQTPTSVSVQSATEESAPEKVESSPEPVEESAPEKESQEESVSETTAPSTEADIEETVLLDESGIKITAKGIDYEASFMGPKLKLLIENESGTDLVFQCRDSSVNGYMIDTSMSAEVVSGKKINDGITFTSSDLELCGIDTIADMEFSFHIFDSENWDTFLDTPKISLKTSAAATYTYQFDDSGDIAYEGNGLKIVVKGLSDETSIFGPGVITYIENDSEKDVTVQVRDVSVNGFMVNPSFSCDVAAGKHAIDDITFMSSDLEENDITTIDSIELSFHVFSFEDFETIVDTDVVTITF